jgi:hypothetical protein
MAEEKKKMLIVFLREYTSSEDNKPGLFFLRVTQEEFDKGGIIDDEDNNKIVGFRKKALSVGQPGNVYRVDYVEKEEGRISIFPDTKQYVGQWPNDAMRLKWESENRAFVNQREAKALEKKESTKALLDQTLNPLREHYHRIPYPQRQALAVVTY